MQTNRHSKALPNRLTTYLDDAVSTGLRHYHTGRNLLDTGIGLYRGLRDLWAGLHSDTRRLASEGRNVAHDLHGSLRNDFNQFKSDVRSDVDRYTEMITQGAARGARPSHPQPPPPPPPMQEGGETSTVWEEEEEEEEEEEVRGPTGQKQFYTISPSLQGPRPPMHSDQLALQAPALTFSSGL